MRVSRAAAIVVVVAALDVAALPSIGTLSGVPGARGPAAAGKVSVVDAAAVAEASKSWAAALPSTRDLQVCGPAQMQPIFGCNVSVVLCSINGSSFTANASAIRSNGEVNKVVPSGAAFPSPEAAFADVFYRLMLEMNVTATSTDCGCERQSSIRQGFNCTLDAAFCVYFKNSTSLLQNNSDSLLYRSRVFDGNSTGMSGSSPGWIDPAKGLHDEGSAISAAVKQLKMEFPNRNCGKVPPLVIVPGFSSTQIEYQMNNVGPPPGHPFCRRNTNGWQPLYPPPKNMSLLDYPCLALNVASVFETTTNSFGPLRKGLQTEVLDFGGFDGIPGFEPAVGYFELAGWTRNKTLFGVPFDWRLPSTDMGPLYSNMKSLIEYAYESNGNEKVALWAFSGGPQWTLSFLHRMDQTWKDKYIIWFVASSPVWSGTPLALSVFATGATGNGEDLPPLESTQMKTLAQGLPSALWYFPRPGINSSTAWTNVEPVVITKSKNYSAFDVVQLFEDLGLSSTQIAAYKYLSSEPDLGQFDPPGVNTFVTYGTGIPSPLAFQFDYDFTPHVTTKGPAIVYNETGDGLVTMRSSRRGLEWFNDMAATGKTLYYRDYPMQPHAECFNIPLSPGAPQVAVECFNDVMNVLVTGHLPNRTM